jgi:hypothetical protein
MPGQVRITFKNFKGLDLSGARKISVPRQRPNWPGEEEVRRYTLQILAQRPESGLLRKLLEMMTPPLGMVIVSGTIPGVRIRLPMPDYTITDGVSGSAGAVANFSAGGGLYFWNKRPDGEIGIYGSLSAGLITNIGASVGVQLGFLFGKAPDVLAGDSIVVSVDVEIVAATVTGMLVLNTPPGGIWPITPAALSTWTPEVIGIGFGLSVGLSALPADISVMPSHTWTHSIDPLHPVVV